MNGTSGNFRQNRRHFLKRKCFRSGQMKRRANFAFAQKTRRRRRANVAHVNLSVSNVAERVMNCSGFSQSGREVENILHK